MFSSNLIILHIINGFLLLYAITNFLLFLYCLPIYILICFCVCSCSLGLLALYGVGVNHRSECELCVNAVNECGQVYQNSLVFVLYI